MTCRKQISFNDEDNLSNNNESDKSHDKNDESPQPRSSYTPAIVSFKFANNFVSQIVKITLFKSVSLKSHIMKGRYKIKNVMRWFSKQGSSPTGKNLCTLHHNSKGRGQ